MKNLSGGYLERIIEEQFFPPGGGLHVLGLLGLYEDAKEKGAYSYKGGTLKRE